LHLHRDCTEYQLSDIGKRNGKNEGNRRKLGKNGNLGKKETWLYLLHRFSLFFSSKAGLSRDRSSLMSNARPDRPISGSAPSWPTAIGAPATAGETSVQGSAQECQPLGVLDGRPARLRSSLFLSRSCRNTPGAETSASPISKFDSLSRPQLVAQLLEADPSLCDRKLLSRLARPKLAAILARALEAL
jgi:hypothetical protein